MTPDFWRYLAFGQAAIVALLSTGILIRYAFIFKNTPQKEKALPLHIICISASYLMLTVSALFELRLRLGGSYTWRTPVYLVAFSLGDIALIFMLIHISVKRILIRAILEEATAQTKREFEEKHKENKVVLEEIAEVVHKIEEKVKTTSL